MTRHSHRSKEKLPGFTLPEVLVGIAVITLVIVSATQLMAALIRSNTENVNTLVAYGLAQEGLEGVRNIRDSNWLLGADYQGRLGRAKTPIWQAIFPDLSSKAQFYTLDTNVLDTSANISTVLGVSDVASVTPWKLENITVAEAGDDREVYGKKTTTALYKKQDDTLEGAEIHYTHQLTDAVSPFHRFIRIEPLSYDNEGISLSNGVNPADTIPSKYRVTSVVTWDEKGRQKEVRLETELTNWKEGY